MPAQEYRIRPRDAATRTMQMAMKIVEIRIMLRERPSSLARERFAHPASISPSGATLASMLIREASVLLRARRSMVASAPDAFGPRTGSASQGSGGAGGDQPHAAGRNAALAGRRESRHARGSSTGTAPTLRQ